MTVCGVSIFGCCLNTSNFVLVQSLENQVEIGTVAEIVQIDILDFCIKVDGAVWSGLCTSGITRLRDIDWCGNGSCATCSDSTALVGFRSDGVVCCCGQGFDHHGRLVLQYRCVIDVQFLIVNRICSKPYPLTIIHLLR